MVLYIGQYDLSFLRVLVLWFLAVLTVLLSGFLVYLYRRTFSLFRFLLTTVLFSWLLLVFIRPDFWIARYNMEQGKQEEIDFEYVYTLSRDAAPALSGLSEGSQAQLFWFWKDLEENYKNRSIREWNLSSWLAKESAESWMEKQYGGSPESLIH